MKKRILILLSCLALFLISCSTSEETSGTDNQPTQTKNLSNGYSFDEENGYDVYIKDDLNYGVYEYDIDTLTKTDIGINIPVLDSKTSFLHSFTHNNYIYIVSSSIYNDSFVTRVSADNLSDMQTIKFEQSEFITFEENLDKVIFSDESLYLILSKNNTFSDGNSDYLTEINFETLEYTLLEKLPTDATILASYNDLIYLNAIENPVKILYSYNTSDNELLTLKENLILTSTYIINDNFFFTMNQNNTGIKRENLDTGEDLDVTLEAEVYRSSLVGIYDNRVLFGYERLDEYRYFNMNLDDMILTEMFIYYNDEEIIPPTIIAELSDSFIIEIEGETGNEEIAIISKKDFWISRDTYTIFN